MNTEDQATWHTTVARRCLGPAAFLLALLLFLLLPVASVSCGGNQTGPAHLCYSGRQFLSGRPGVTLVDVLGPGDLAEGLGNTVALPGAARVLAVVVVVALVAGALGGVLPQPELRAAVMTAAALTGAALLCVMEIVALHGLTANAGLIMGLFVYRSGPALDADDIVTTAIGFWLALIVLLPTAAIGAWWLSGRRWERDFPVTDAP